MEVPICTGACKFNFPNSTQAICESFENVSVLTIMLIRRRQKKGKYTRLVGRHAPYPIGHRAADRWLEHMEAAVADHSILKDSREAREKISKYFRYTAHYIVVASEYMRPDQVRRISFVGAQWQSMTCECSVYDSFVLKFLTLCY